MISIILSNHSIYEPLHTVSFAFLAVWVNRGSNCWNFPPYPAFGLAVKKLLPPPLIAACFCSEISVAFFFSADSLWTSSSVISRIRFCSSFVLQCNGAFSFSISIALHRIAKASFSSCSRLIRAFSRSMIFLAPPAWFCLKGSSSARSVLVLSFLIRQPFSSALVPGSSFSCCLAFSTTLIQNLHQCAGF